MSLFSPYVLLAIVIAVLGSYGAGRAQQFHRDEIRWTKKWDAATKAASEEKARLEMLRQKERESAEIKQQEMARERDRLMARSQKRIADLDAAIASMRAPGIARLLNDTLDESSGTAGTAPKPAKDSAAAAAGPDTSIGQWAQWSVTCINLYAAARDQILGWQTFYAKLRTN